MIGTQSGIKAVRGAEGRELPSRPTHCIDLMLPEKGLRLSRLCLGDFRLMRSASGDRS